MSQMHSRQTCTALSRRPKETVSTSLMRFWHAIWETVITYLILYRRIIRRRNLIMIIIPENAAKQMRKSRGQKATWIQMWQQNVDSEAFNSSRADILQARRRTLAVDQMSWTIHIRKTHTKMVLDATPTEKVSAPPIHLVPGTDKTKTTGAAKR